MYENRFAGVPYVVYGRGHYSTLSYLNTGAHFFSPLVSQTVCHQLIYAMIVLKWQTHNASDFQPGLFPFQVDHFERLMTIAISSWLMKKWRLSR